MKNEALTRPEAAQPATTANRYTYTPKCDIWETADTVYLEAELPGVEEQNVDIKLEDGVLSILGRVNGPDFAGYQRSYCEYESGNFERSFRVSEAIDEERITAALKNGLLHVELPKREAVKPRRIQVAVA